MIRKRVLLIESGKFIGGVFRSLFYNYEHLTVIGVKPSNERELLKSIQENRPQIIVMDDTLTDYLTYLLNYMPGCEDLRVIVVHTDQNRVEVYQKQQINVSQTADFFAIM